MQIESQASAVLPRHMFTCIGNLVGEEDRRLYFTFAHTCRAGLHHLHFHRRPYPLARDLHQSELAEWQHVVLCPVAFHQFAYIVVQFLLVVFVIHVDKIDDDYSPNVAQTQLVHQLIGCEHVELERIFLLVLVNLLAAGVDIYGEQCFGFVDDEIPTVFETDRSAEPRFHLTGNVEMVEDRLRVVVELNNIRAFRSDEFEIMSDFVVNIPVINLNRSEIGAEQISYYSDCPAHFFAHKADGFPLLQTFHRLFPTLHE